MTTENKCTVEKYLDGFREIIPGAFHLVGKQAFDGEIENPAFVGSPKIEILMELK